MGGASGSAHTQVQTPVANDMLLPSISPPKQRPGVKSKPVSANFNREGSSPSPAAVTQSNTTLGAESAFQALQNVLSEKDSTIADLRETVEILQNKVSTLEKLVKLKDAKIHALAQKLDRK